MAKSIRIHPTISMVAHQHLEAAIEAGETMSAIINRLLIHQLPKPGHITGTPTAPKKMPISTLRANLKGVRAKIAVKHEEKEGIERRAGTITFAQQDELYDLYQKAAEIKYQLGEDPRTADEVMQGFYQRELARLEAQYTSDTDRFEAGELTEIGEKAYYETGERIITLKDRLK